MAENEGDFNVEKFYLALDGARRGQGLTWKEVSDRAKVHTSTLSRMASGRRPDATSLALLAAWSGLNPADFVNGIERQRVDALAQLSAFVHNDPQLSREAARVLDELIKSTYVRLVSKNGETDDK